MSAAGYSKEGSERSGASAPPATSSDPSGSTTDPAYTRDEAITPVFDHFLVATSNSSHAGDPPPASSTCPCWSSTTSGDIDVTGRLPGAIWLATVCPRSGAGPKLVCTLFST